MLRSSMTVAGTTVAALGLASIMNCGGSGNVVTGGTGGSGASSSHSATSASTTGTGGSTGSAPFMPHLPPPPPATMPPSGSTVTLAVSKLYLGDTDPDGTPDQANGWTYYGYNIDGVNPKDPSKFCKTVGNASPVQVHQEGMNGIENSFGHNILPVVLAISSNASSTINDSIAAGKFTIMVELEQLGTASNANPVAAQLFLGSNLGQNPKFDGTDNWPVSPVLLEDGMTVAGGSKVQFPMSYLTNDTWVSGSKGMVTLALSIQGYTLDLNISNAVITMNLDLANKKATGGIISGVLQTQQLLSEIQTVAAAVGGSSFCSGSTVCAVLDEIAQASDILSDGTQDPTKTCDGISIGIGFDAALVENPSLVGPPPAMPDNPCGDAGTVMCPGL